MNDTLKAAGRIGAELGAAKAELERLRELLERIRTTCCQVRDAQDLDTAPGLSAAESLHEQIEKLDAALSQQAEPADAPCMLTDGPAEFNDVPLVPLAALSAVTAERDRLREEMAELWKRIDKFQSQSHGITALAEIERLRAEVDGLRKAFMKMRNVAAGYSNCCEFDSANTRRLDREFEAADELFRSSAALAAKEA